MRYLVTEDKKWLFVTELWMAARYTMVWSCEFIVVFHPFIWNAFVHDNVTNDQLSSFLSESTVLIVSQEPSYSHSRLTVQIAEIRTNTVFIWELKSLREESFTQIKPGNRESMLMMNQNNILSPNWWLNFYNSRRDSSIHLLEYLLN